MQIPPIAQQLIDIDRQTQQTQADIATAVLVKQQDVAKQQATALVDLIQQVPQVTSNGRGIDIKA